VKSADRPLPSLDVERFATGPVLLIAAALFALDMVLSWRYGFHGDELYFLDSARHLQGGYVDQPILVPLLARVSLSLFGVSLPGLRVWAALAVAATVVIGGLLARELGGRRNAQLLAALATATIPAVIGTGDLLEPTTLDILFWAALALVVVRVGRTSDCRYWLLGGVVLGAGLANKHSIGFFAVAIFFGALLSGGWRLVLNRWALAGAVIAAFFTIPDVWWQAAARLAYDRHDAGPEPRERGARQHQHVGGRPAAHGDPRACVAVGRRDRIPMAIEPSPVAPPSSGPTACCSSSSR